MKKKILAIALSIITIAVLVAGCGNSNSNQAVATTTSNEETTIRMWTFLDPTNTSNGRSVALKKMMTEFEAENPGVKIVVEPQDWTTMTGKFLAAAQSGQAPDVMWCARDELFGVLNANALEPLENLFMKDWTNAQKEDVNDGFFKFGERNGKHYTLTLNKNCTGLFYREDLLKKAGLSSLKTFDDIFEAAKAMTGKDETTGIDRYGLGMSFSTETNDAQAVVNWLLQENGALFDSQGKANWANEAGKKGVEWVKKCVDEGVTPKEAVNTTIEDIYTEFAAGKYGMAIASAVRLSSLRDSATFDGNTIQFTPLPGGTIIDGWFAGVWSGSKNKEMAGKWLEKMYTNESDLLWVNDGGQAPCRKSTVGMIEINDNNKYLNSMLEAFADGWLPSNNMAFNGWKLDLSRPLQAVIGNNEDVMKALKDAEDKFNSANGR